MDSGIEVSCITHITLCRNIRSVKDLLCNHLQYFEFYFRYYAIEVARQRKNVIAVSSGAPLLVGSGSNLMTTPNGGTQMPWLIYLRSPALW